MHFYPSFLPLAVYSYSSQTPGNKIAAKKWDSQGSILGPLLFPIYINGLLSCLKTVTGFFADDAALFLWENV